MLSIGGRITLIKSSLANLHLYYMSLFPMPKGVIEKINKITRQFLWCGCEEKRSLSLVSWDIVQLPKAIGGLSIGNILHKNLAILYKWIWRFFQDPFPLRCQVIRTKYKYTPYFSISDLEIPRSGGPWRRICAAIFNHANAKLVMIHGMWKNIGNGTNTLFWHDLWFYSQPLKRSILDFSQSQLTQCDSCITWFLGGFQQGVQFYLAEGS